MSTDCQAMLQPLEPFLEVRGFRRNENSYWELTLADDVHDRLAVVLLANPANERAFDVELHMISNEENHRDMVFLTYRKPIETIQQLEKFLAAMEEVCQ